MFDVFIQYLKEKSSLTDTEIEQVCAPMVKRRLRKKQYLLQEGEISHYNCFISKGCLRLYLIGENGAEHILRFGIETWWMADYESYNSGNPSKGNIDALEDSEILMMEKNDFDTLVETVPNFRHFKEKLEARSYGASLNRIMSNISDTAEKRYEHFIKTYPDIYNRVPLHMVASYLGLTRETLSRIRSQYTKTDK